MSSKASIWASAAVMLVTAAWQCDALAASNAPAAGDVEQTTVRFGDLNLDRPADTAVLYLRSAPVLSWAGSAPRRICSREPRNLPMSGGTHAAAHSSS
jgi:hypothetical protein